MMMGKLLYRARVILPANKDFEAWLGLKIPHMSPGAAYDHARVWEEFGSTYTDYLTSSAGNITNLMPNYSVMTVITSQPEEVVDEVFANPSITVKETEELVKRRKKPQPKALPSVEIVPEEVTEDVEIPDEPAPLHGFPGDEEIVDVEPQLSAREQLLKSVAAKDIIAALDYFHDEIMDDCDTIGECRRELINFTVSLGAQQ